MFCGIALISALLVKAVYQLVPWFEFPILGAQLLVFTGAGISLWHYLELKRSTSDISKPSCLIRESALYRFVRHPMYLGDMVAYTGLFLLFPTFLSALILSLGLVSLVRQSQIEDAHLALLFGAEYKQWKAATKLIVPSIY